MAAELLNVDDSGTKIYFKFETRHVVKPLYGVTNERTFELFMYHAHQDLMKYSLLVSVEEEGFRSAQESNDPSKSKKESSNLVGLESILEGANLENTNKYIETNVLPNVFANQDVFEREFDIPTPQGSPYVVAASPQGNPYVITTPPQGNPNVAVIMLNLTRGYCGIKDVSIP